MKSFIGILLCCMVFTGCKFHYTEHNPPPPRDFSKNVQQIAALAFVSYAGDDLENTDPKVDETLQACVAWELSRQPVLDKRFELAWGPSVHRFELAELDDNMMYAVWDQQDRKHLIIGIRGTNPDSISDWIDEDFFVSKSVQWPYAKPQNPDLRITEATYIGLTVLQRLKGDNHSPGCGGSIQLQDFIVEHWKNGQLNRVTVTGHSLAGALAPTFALWLHDEVLMDSGVQIEVLPIAGATPGNRDFADYYDVRLGGTTNRLHNPFDVVPQAWYLPSMKALPSIYTTREEKKIRPTLSERAAFDLGIELAEDKNYTHVNADQESTGGVIYPEIRSFAGQAAWQHHCGYYNALGMVDSVYNTNTYCLTEQECGPNGSTDPKVMCECANLSKLLCPNFKNQCEESS